MTRARCSNPVRPLHDRCCSILPEDFPFICGPCLPIDGDLGLCGGLLMDDLGVDDLAIDERIVGPDNTKTQREKHRVQPLPESKDMTKDQWARHCLTHIPFSSA